MRIAWIAAAVALAGCAEARMGGAAPPKVPYPPEQFDTIGHTHEPYTGKPAYLASARPLLPTTTPQLPRCAQRSQKCDDRLRAVLDAVDAQILALSSPPTELQLKALKLQLAEIQPLLAPYSDIMPERDELAALVDKLPTEPTIQQAATKRRMTELSDLIRVQLAAAQ